jgi:membrane protein
VNSGRLEKSFDFTVRVLRKAHRDALALRASSLAYTTLVSLVPLLATISFFVARTLREDDGSTLRLLAQLLPYREESILAALQAFVGQAESVRGLGLAGFVFASLSGFLAVDSTLHRIFAVETETSLLRRLRGFALLVFSGPLLIGAAYSTILLMSQRPGFGRFATEALLVRALPGVVTFVGLTLVFWRASTGRVRIGHAAVGSLVSTLALEALKIGFTLYVASFTAVQRVVYGGFAIALFFILSVQIAWWIFLVGAEIAICLARPEEPLEPVEPPFGTNDAWSALAALGQLARIGAAHDALALADAAGVEPPRLRRLLSPLTERGLIVAPFTVDGDWRLALPPDEIRVTRVLEAYEPVTAPGDDPLAAARRRALQAANAEIGGLTLAELGETRRPPTPASEPEPPPDAA